MNKKQIHSFSDRFLPKNLKREQLCDNTKFREKCMCKRKVFTQHAEYVCNFQLNPQNLQSLNLDYFYSDTDQKQSLRFRGDQSSPKEPNNQDLLKSYSEEGKLQAQLEELRIIKGLNVKLIELESNFFQIQSHQNQQIVSLRYQLKAKSQQTQQLCEVLRSLSSQQKSTADEVEVLMSIISGSCSGLQNAENIGKRVQHRQTQCGNMLPLNSKGEQNQYGCIKPKSKRGQGNHVIQKKGSDKGEDKKLRQVKSEQRMAKLRNRQKLFGKNPKRTLLNSCTIKG